MININFPPYNYGLSGTSYFGSNSQQGYTSYQECALVLVLLPLRTVALCSKSQGRHFCVEEPTFFISVLTWFILHSFTIVLHDFFNTECWNAERGSCSQRVDLSCTGLQLQRPAASHEPQYKLLTYLLFFRCCIIKNSYCCIWDPLNDSVEGTHVLTLVSGQAAFSN